MLKNYFVTACRNLLRNKSYTAINIVGLAVGIAACLLLFVVIRFETSFDTFHRNGDRIYRVATEFETPDGEAHSAGAPLPVPEALRLDFPQLTQVAAIHSASNRLISIPQPGSAPAKKFMEERGVFLAEPQFFNIFNFPWLAGDPKTALSAPNTGVITRETAERYFGDWRTAMGKTLVLENEDVIKVTGILADVPANTDFPLKVVVSYETYRKSAPLQFTDWISTSSGAQCYVVLPDGLSPDAFNSSLTAFVKKHKPAEYVKDNLILQPLRDIHFNEQFGNFQDRTFSRSLINSLTLIGIFLLIIACVNFINLATAQAVNRAKEVGVRKVLGGNRRQLMAQFIGETALITAASIALAIGIAAVALPALASLLEVPLRFPFDGTALLFLLAVAAGVTIVSGFYPAVVLSGFNPINALKSKEAAKTTGGISLRRALVVLQFCVAQILIISTLVVVRQTNYFRNAPLGFDKEAIVQVPLHNDSANVARYDYLRNQLASLPRISSFTFSFASPADDGGWHSDFKFDGSMKNTDFGANLKWADTAYFNLYNLQFIAGRPYRQSDTAREVVVNETLLQKLGVRNPQDIIGKSLNFWDGRKVLPVVGVIKDFHSASLHQPMQPVVMGCWERVYQTVGIKLKPGNTSHTLAGIEKAWTATFPDFVYEYEFLDERVTNFYQQEAQLSVLYKIFAGLAIFISCLGLYGLVSFMALRRTREVGIRKVLGASARSIVYLFSKEFTVLVGVAFIIAAPVAYYFMKQWLDGFSFRISLNAGLFLSAVGVSVAIAWLTVGYKALKAAHANPVKSLRTE